MFKKSLDEAPEFIAGDKTILRELLQPDKDNVPTGYSIAHAQVMPGKASVPHRLAGSEVYHILQGTGIMCIDDESEHVKPGDTIFVPPKASQYIVNTGNDELTFICIVEPAWKEEDEIIE